MTLGGLRIPVRVAAAGRRVRWNRSSSDGDGENPNSDPRIRPGGKRVTRIGMLAWDHQREVCLHDTLLFLFASGRRK
jgi:hypothetical protein